MKINIQKYDNFIKEKIENLYNDLLKYNTNIEDKSIGELDIISNSLTEKYKEYNIPFKDSFNFGGIDITFNVFYSNRNYSYINWFDFFNNNDRTINIEIKENYDYNYLISIMIHELRHILDISNSKEGIIDSFNLEVNLRAITNEKYKEFITLVYISLEHELVARNNQIYPYIKFKELNKEDSLSIVKNSNIWRSLNLLSEFNIDIFIKKFDENELIHLTNIFIEKILLSDDGVNNMEDIYIFYEQFKKYFLFQEKEYKKILLSEIDKIYEIKMTSYIEYENYSSIIKKYYKNIKNV